MRAKRGGRVWAFRPKGALGEQLEQALEASGLSATDYLNKLLSTSFSAGLARRVQRVIALETAISDDYAADAHGARRADIIDKVQKGAWSRERAVRNLQRLEKIAAHHARISRWNRASWEEQARADRDATRALRTGGPAPPDLPLAEKPVPRAEGPVQQPLPDGKRRWVHPQWPEPPPGGPSGGPP